MSLVRVDAMFRIFPATVSYNQKVKLRPNEYHYENEGEEPCVKYTCQICEQLAEKINKLPFYTGKEQFVPFSFPKGTKKCPCCGVNIDWGYK